MGKLQVQKLFEKGTVWQATGSNNYRNNNPKKITIEETKLASFNISDIDSVLPYGGLHYGAVHEFFIEEINVGPLTSYLRPHGISLQLIRNNLQNYINRYPDQELAFKKYIAWIGKDFFPYPAAINEFLSFPSTSFSKQCIFLKPQNPQSLLSCIETTLQSSAVIIAIAYCHNISFAISRKLARLADKHQSLLILYRPVKEIKTKSFAASRWKLTPQVSPIKPLKNQAASPAWLLELLQCKGKKTAYSSWIIEQKKLKGFSLIAEDNDENISLHLLPTAAQGQLTNKSYAA